MLSISEQPPMTNVFVSGWVVLEGWGYIIQILLPHICTWGKLAHTSPEIFTTSLHRVIEFSAV